MFACEKYILFFCGQDLIALLCYQIMPKKTLQNKIDRLKQQIVNLGPLRPGTLYERHSVCGKPGCRCSHPKNPVRHGPYHYLSYTFKGKSYTEFVSKQKLSLVQREIDNYHKLMEKVKALVHTSIELARLKKSK